MVGKKAVLAVMIHKSLMNSAVNCRKRYLIPSVFKYIFQPFRLIRRIRQYKDTITVTDKITETL